MPKSVQRFSWSRPWVHQFRVRTMRRYETVRFCMDAPLCLASRNKLMGCALSCVVPTRNRDMPPKVIGALFGVMIVGCLGTVAHAQCDDKSQQNAADEAIPKGDLTAASKCADAADRLRSQKMLEDAAERAKARTREHSSSVGQSEPRDSSPSSTERR
jgi:hypothetical protein